MVIYFQQFYTRHVFPALLNKALHRKVICLIHITIMDITVYTTTHLLLLLLQFTVIANGHELIPSHFTNQNISQYSVRYLSMVGSDGQACLRSQPFPYDRIQVQPCRSLRYAVTGGNEYMTNNVSNVIVLVLPGKYSYGNVSIWLNYAENVAVRKVLSTEIEGEAILNCTEFLPTSYNNFYFVYSNYVLLEGLVFTECGPHSHALSFHVISFLILTNCTFR